MAAAGRPLAGLRVLSLAEQYPGPFASLILGDLGAEVTIVERPPHGDPSRRAPGFFDALNRGKRSVALDLKQAEAREALEALARGADVLLEGFRPGTLARLGLGPDRLAEVNPRLVYVSLSGFGQDGPLRDVPAHDLSFQAMSGALHRALGERSAEAPWLALSNVVGGLYAVVGALAALRARDAAGRGSVVDVSLLDSMLSMLTAYVVPVLNGTGPAIQPSDPAYGLFRTADGRVVSISIFGEDHLWAALCRALGIRGARLTFAERSAMHRTLVPRLRRAVAKRAYAEWDAVFREAGIPFTPVLDFEGAADHPQVRARGTIVSVDGPAGTRRYVRQPVRFDGAAGGPASQSPAVGADTRAALLEAGLDQARVDRLLGSGAAHQA